MTPTPERTFHKRWDSVNPPERLLVIRLHAIGDVAITFPYCAGFQRKFPSTSVDILTTEGSEDLANASGLFRRVHSIRIPEGRSARFGTALQTGISLHEHRYDVILDLQRNWITRLIRIAAAPSGWAEFDRFSSRPAGVRTQDAFHQAGFADVEPMFRLPINPSDSARAATLLMQQGWNGTDRLVVLNPAGLWETRNWPLSSYVALARLWLATEKVRFVLIGTERISAKSNYLRNELGSSVLDLVGQTDLGTALATLQRVSMVISEDSGLMHMSWISGIPTLALFGSSRSDWSRPLGKHSIYLSSEDLECGQCMQPVCRYGDVHCLTRHAPEKVFQAAQQLLSKEAAT